MRWIKKAEYKSDFKIHVVFDNQKTFDVDFKDLLNGPIYEPLKNIKKFKEFFVHPELEVLTWPNGADFSPEFLYNIAKKQQKKSA